MNKETVIHPTAIVEKGAELDSGVFVGPYSIIGPNVKVGKGTWIQSHANLQGHTNIGEENEIFAFASVGNPPQDLKYKGEPTLLKIGSKNKIREYATLQPGTVQGGGETAVGSGNLFMAYTHVAHDCVIGNGNILANGAQLAGHVTLFDGVILGALCGIHQFSRLGDMAMIAAGAMVSQDVPPFCMAHGDHAKLRGLNVVGLKRRGVNVEKLTAIKAAYRAFFHAGSATVEQAAERCEQEGLLTHLEVQLFVKFISASQRGVIRPVLDGESVDV